MSPTLLEFYEKIKGNFFKKCKLYIQILKINHNKNINSAKKNIPKKRPLFFGLNTKPKFGNGL
jgi:hypothetical protein